MDCGHGIVLPGPDGKRLKMGAEKEAEAVQIKVMAMREGPGQRPGFRRLVKGNLQLFQTPRLREPAADHPLLRIHFPAMITGMFLDKLVDQVALFRQSPTFEFHQVSGGIDIIRVVIIAEKFKRGRDGRLRF